MPPLVSRLVRLLPGAILILGSLGGLRSAEESVATAVYARSGHGYKRAHQADGTFKAEYYGLANGGRIAGTGSDITVDRITYPEVAEIAMRLLAKQNYHYAQRADQATLLIMLQWGATIAFNSGNYALSVGNASSALANLKVLGSEAGGTAGGAGSMGGPSDTGSNAVAAAQAAGEAFEGEMLKLFMENRAREQVNLGNAKVLGYLDEINDSDDIRRWAGGGDRYNDLIADVEESRYYIVITAYDFAELTQHNKKKLLWQTKVSVRAPGNRFDDSVMAMMKSASKYFGQDNRRLIRGEETKGTVEMGDLKFLGATDDAPVKAKADAAKVKK